MPALPGRRKGSQERKALIKIGILGGSGYGGSELLRILLFHPEVELTLVTANEHVGKRIDAVHPNLAKLTDLKFASMPDPVDLDGLDCVFLALPHGQSRQSICQAISA